MIRQSKLTLDLNCFWVFLMNSAAIKKWSILIGLLIITLVLVWRAPAPDQTPSQDIVKSVSRSRQDSSLLIDHQQANLSLAISSRKYGPEQTIDLFKTPKKVVTATVAVIKQPTRSSVTRRLTLPFRYIGKLVDDHTTVFVMDQSSLYPVRVGNIVNKKYKLTQIDEVNDELIWLYLPTHETLKMSTQE